MNAGVIDIVKPLAIAQTENGIGAMLVVGIAGAALLFLFTFVFLATRYKRCPANRILVIWGGKDGLRCYHGGGQFIWPVIEDFAYLSLDLIHCTVDLRNVVTNDNSLVRGQSVFKAGITTDPEKMHLAAERLLGVPPEAIQELAMDLVKAHQRKLISELSVQDLETNPQLVLDKLARGASEELLQIGIELIEFEVLEYPKVVDTVGNTHHTTNA
ncbi:MAG: hypothetical protein Phyf2KO_23190 [Phycisphaerales bacterium]